MTKIYYACNEIPRHWAQYFKLCNAIELDLTELDNPPKIETLNSWRVDSPKGFAFFLHADSGVTQELVKAAETDNTQLSQKLRQSWDLTVERAQALAAKTIIIKTPYGFSPGNTSRALMEKVGDELASECGKPVIWEAAGMWDNESAREFGLEHGLTYAYDPFIAIRDEIGLTHGDGAFILSERAGMRRDFDRYDLRGLLDRLGSYNRVFFLLRGRFKWEHARHFRDLTGHSA